MSQEKKYFFVYINSSLKMIPLLEAGAIRSYFNSICSAFLTCYLIFVRLPLSDTIFSLDDGVVAILFLTKLP